MLPDIKNRIDGLLWGSQWDHRGGLLAILIHICRYLYALVRDFFGGQLTLRAMSLVYTTLLSVVPLIAISFAVFKGLGYHYELADILLPFLEPLGGEERATEITTKLVEFVDNVRGKTLGTVGLAFFLYTVISMIQKIEEAFNYVWQVDTPRSFGRRFSEYLSVLLVGPALMVTAMTLIGSMTNHALVLRLSEIQPFGDVIVLLGKLMPYFVVIIVFSFLYVFIPNTKVRLGAALVGGITAGTVWAATGAFFAAFVAGSVRRFEIYGGFAVGIVALIWLYLNWLILLIGAQLAYYRQHPESLHSGRTDVRLPNRERESLALAAMLLIARDFVRGEKGRDTNELAAELGLPSMLLGPIIQRLEKSRLLRFTEDEKLIPGRALDGIALGDIIAAVRGPATTSMPQGAELARVGELMDELDGAINAQLGGRNLRELAEDAGLQPSSTASTAPQVPA